MTPDLDKIDQAILKLISSQPQNPSSTIQSQFSLSRQAITKRLQKLQSMRLIAGEGKGRGRRYYLIKSGDDRFDVKNASQIGTWRIGVPALSMLGEDRFYHQKIAPALTGASPQAAKILEHIFTELINNVIDHSKGHWMDVGISEVDNAIKATIKDDGIGVILSISEGLNQAAWEAVSELMKGKRTTDPEKHAGEGLFFSMRLADCFQIDANKISVIYDANMDDWTFYQNNELADYGSEISFSLDLATSRQITEVFAKYSDENLDFVRQRPFIVKPYTIVPGRSMVSRSEAKRLMTSAEGMESILIDFKDVTFIGQGFADEVFRVWANRHPQTAIGVENATEVVAFMIKRLLLPANVSFLP